MARFTIEKISLVASLSLNIHNDMCPICRNQITDKCLECSNDESKANIECKSAVGTCNHGYHYHCITTWLKNKKTCPLDNQRWEFQKHIGNEQLVVNVPIENNIPIIEDSFDDRDDDED